jgi:hypothetical protein
MLFIVQEVPPNLMIFVIEAKTSRVEPKMLDLPTIVCLFVKSIGIEPLDKMSAGLSAVPTNLHSLMFVNC